MVIFTLIKETFNLLLKNTSNTFYIFVFVIFQGRCVICGGPGVSDAYYCKECTVQEKDVSAYLKFNLNTYV